jgi:hypothetical protein
MMNIMKSIKLMSAALLALQMAMPAYAGPDPAEASAAAAIKTESTPMKGKDSLTFDQTADQALKAMTKRAEELRIQGVAVVALLEGDPTQSWTSKMTVVGKLRNAPSGNNKGANLLAIAYSKAAEMADTLKNSGSGVRPPMNGELGYQGGLIAKGKTGYLIAAFSGGPAEDDLKVSRAGLDVLTGGL